MILISKSSRLEAASPSQQMLPTAHVAALIGLALVCFARFPFVAAAGTEKDSFKGPRFSMTAQFLGVADSAGNNSFSVRRVRLGIRGKILGNLRYKLSGEYSDTAILLDALAEFEIQPAFSVRAGQFKIPFSMESFGSVAERDLINRSLVVNRLAPGRDTNAHGRDIGIAVFGKAGPLEYNLAILNGAGINHTDVDHSKDLAGRLVLRPAGWVLLGGSLYRGRRKLPPDEAAIVRHILGFEINAKLGAHSLKGEYISAYISPNHRAGWYLIASSYLGRSRTLQIAVRKEALAFDPTLTEYYRTWTLGITWYLGIKTKVQLNYEARRQDQKTSTYTVFLVQLQAGF
jgi:phosphate-selective porin OprO/OprP